jgi:hypothetical protein
MTTTNFPDGSSLVSSALTVDQLFSILQPVLTGALGIQFTDPLAQSTIRKAWQTGGAPAFGITDNIVSVQLTEEENEYDKIRDVSYQNNDQTTLNKTYSYTRVWRVLLVSRGPSGYDNLRVIKSALLLDWAHDTLAASDLYVVPAFRATLRVPEFSDGQVWERSDFNFSLYEGITESTVINAVASVEVKVYNEAGLQLDIELGEATE